MALRPGKVNPILPLVTAFSCADRDEDINASAMNKAGKNLLPLSSGPKIDINTRV